MGVFSFLKKDKTESDSSASAPPPLPPEINDSPLGDVPPIGGSGQHNQEEGTKLPPLPSLPGAPEGSLSAQEIPSNSELPTMPVPDALDSSSADSNRVGSESEKPFGIPPSDSNSRSSQFDKPEPVAPVPAADFPSADTGNESHMTSDSNQTETSEEGDVGMFPQGPIKPQSKEMLDDLDSTGANDVSSSNEFVKPETKRTPSLPRPNNSQIPDWNLGEPVEEDINLDRPLFVRADLYSDVLTGVDDIKRITRDAEEVLYRTKTVREEIDKQYQKWHDELEDIQRKIVNVDQKFFE